VFTVRRIYSAPSHLLHRKGKKCDVTVSPSLSFSLCLFSMLPLPPEKKTLDNEPTVRKQKTERVFSFF
jgi:hypothetical protein